LVVFSTVRFVLFRADFAAPIAIDRACRASGFVASGGHGVPAHG